MLRPQGHTCGQLQLHHGTFHTLQDACAGRSAGNPLHATGHPHDVELQLGLRTSAPARSSYVAQYCNPQPGMKCSHHTQAHAQLLSRATGVPACMAGAQPSHALPMHSTTASGHGNGTSPLRQATCDLSRPQHMPVVPACSQSGGNITTRCDCWQPLHAEGAPCNIPTGRIWWHARCVATAYCKHTCVAVLAGFVDTRCFHCSMLR